jgi:hypothetical protein
MFLTGERANPRQTRGRHDNKSGESAACINVFRVRRIGALLICGVWRQVKRTRFSRYH